MALYDRNYSNTVETGYVQEGATVGFMKKTYKLLAASMIAAAIGAYLTMPYAEVIRNYQLLIWIVTVGIIFLGFRMAKENSGVQLGLLFAVTFLTGVSIVPLLSYLIGSGNGAIIGNAFLMTSVLFGALSIFAINSKKDFSSWGKPLFITLIVIIVLSLINYFLLSSPLLHIVISAAVLLLFSLFTIYDTQNLANGAYDSEVEAALSLYLDFFNIFVSLLQLLGIFGSDD